ncbi:MAG: alpha/beta fold hydrolase [Jatrophihabitans sp.]
MTTTTTGTVPANGIEIAYETLGDPGGHPVLLIMGLGGQLIAWPDRFCEDLAARGCYVIRFDNRDVGASTHFHEAPMPNLMAAFMGDLSTATYTLDDMAQDAFGLLDALEVSAAHVVGMSLGGMIAQAMAIRSPDRVLSLTSIMSTPDPALSNPTPQAQAALMTPLPSSRDEAVEQAVVAGRVVASPANPLDEEWMREVAGRSWDRAPDPVGIMRQTMAVYASGARTDALRELPVRTLVIHGADDPLINVAAGRLTAELIPDARLVVLPGMGHDLPQALWPQLIDEIAGHVAGEGSAVPELERFTDADGVEVAFRTWPVADARGAVVLAHGASEHSGRYARFAGALNDAGWTVLAPDHRGHGATADATGKGVIGPRAMQGVLDDFDHVVGLAREASDGSVVVFGHSLGSIVALRYAQTHPDSLDALALSGPIGVMDGVEEMVPQLQGAVAAGMGETPMDALGGFNAAFEPARTPYDWLSRDEAEVDKYLADPLCGEGVPLTLGWMLAMSEALRDGALEVGRLRPGLPVLLVAGDRDPVSNFTAQARALTGLMREAGLPVEEHYYPGARHEVLNETNREAVQDDVVAWLNGVREHSTT